MNAVGEPLHVFETPPSCDDVLVGIGAMGGQSEPYSGLLVSLHVLHLSLMSQASHPAPRDVFELNKFQHAQIELQPLRPMWACESTAR